ncbi:hypothetical protein Tco_0441580 [Tanacetum coccineum]
MLRPSFTGHVDCLLQFAGFEGSDNRFDSFRKTTTILLIFFFFHGQPTHDTSMATHGNDCCIPRFAPGDLISISKSQSSEHFRSTRHHSQFHDAVEERSLWKAKTRFGGNEASKKMQKNLLKQQFETFTIGSREELDSAYERFQNILSMLELYDAKVSQEDANLKFLRSLPSVWHVVATMIRGQPGLDELDFDDLYNNLKVYEHELKGVSNSNSQNIAFLSTEVKGSTLKQSTADPVNIPKGYTQAASSKVHTAPNYASHSDEIICSFFS